VRIVVQRVFVDANVLVSRTQRDWLFQLRIEADSMFQLHCTEDVLAEVLHTFRRQNPKASGGQTTRLRRSLCALLDEILDDFDATVNYEGTDEHDRHVHSAAVACNADILLTCDEGLLGQQTPDSLPYTLMHPDDFFLLVDDSASLVVRAVTDASRRYWEGKPDAKGLAQALVDAQCPEFSMRITDHLRVLSGLRSERT
jgi:predicted nucleic acid-binding protein